MKRLLPSLAVVLGACGFSGGDKTPDAAIEIDAAAGTATIAPATADWGMCTPTSACANTTFTVTALGTTPTLQVTLVGTDAATFSIVTDTCSGKELPASMTCTIEVAFTHAGAMYGARSALIQISGGATFTASSTLAGDYELLGQLVIAPSALAFGTTPVGTTTAAQTVMLTNTGSTVKGPLTTAKTGTDPGEFTITADTCNGQVLQGFAMCTVQVAYAPNGVGARAASVTLSTTVGGTVGVSATGTGEALRITTVPVMFVDTAVNGTSAATTLTIKNVAANTVGPVATSTAGNHPTDFVITNDTCNGMTLPTQQTCTLDVAFKPTITGMRDGLIRLKVGTTIIADGILRGTGVIPTVDLSFSPASYNFPPTTSGTTSTAQTLTVFNSGSVTSGSLAITVSGTDPTQFMVTADGCTATTVAPGGMCNVAVVFKPTTTGPKTATLVVTDATTPASAQAALSGTAN